MIEQLRQRLQALQKTAGIADRPGTLPLGIRTIDDVLGGGLARGALHEIAAVSEAHLAAATGFALGISCLSWPGLSRPSRLGRHCVPDRDARHKAGHDGNNILWLAEDMALAESGAPYGPGLDAFGLPPEHLLTVAAARPRDLLWAMEEALRCRAVHAVIGELRRGEIDRVAIRRLSLAAAESGALALLLRGAPIDDTSTAATRWIVGAAPNACCAAQLCATAAARSAHRFCNGVTAMSTSCSQRMLSLWLRRLSTDRIARSREVSAPLVVYGKRGNAELIVAVDEAAERLGLHTRRWRCRRAPCIAGSMLSRKTPRPTPACWKKSPTGACATRHWWRVTRPTACCSTSPAARISTAANNALVADLGERIARAGFAYTIAIAGTIRTAWAAAHYGEPASYACGEQRTLLSPLPLSALRLPADTVAALARVGLKRIGDIIDLARAPLTARFGGELMRQLDRALGREHEPLNPRLPVAPYVAEQRFAEPIAREQDILAIVTRLAARLQFALERRGDGARRIELTLFRTDGAVRRLAAGTSRPLRDPAQIRALFVERLAALADEFDPGFGFDMARLSVMVTEPSPPEQIGIGGGEEETEVDRLVDRLSARLGARRVRRLIAQDSHIPEIAAATVPAQMTADPGWPAFRHFRAEAELAPRPLRLLTRPEPIEALAEVPDGPPLRFRWRRALHEVIAAEGPERIEGAWWSEQGGPARDYFHVEDKSGLRFWLFRAGLYRDLARDAAAPTWFLHGTFA